jgi:hypothetical protein
MSLAAFLVVSPAAEWIKLEGLAIELRFGKAHCHPSVRAYIGVRAGKSPRLTAGSGVAIRECPLGRGVQI